MPKKIKIGLIDGTGFYEFFEGQTKEVLVKTKFGLPSDKIIIGNLFGRKIAFLPRHGRKHQLPPQGMVVVIEGPRFSTLADSLRFSQMGADLVN